VHGLGIDKTGRLFAGSVAGAALYEVDRSNGTAKIAVASPEGMADDIAFAPDGTMPWTAFLTGDLYSRKGDGPVRKLASGLLGINSLAFRKDGKLYATQVFLGDALYEIDIEGVKPPGGTGVTLAKSSATAAAPWATRGKTNRTGSDFIKFCPPAMEPAWLLFG
jgi:outer membrane protein assembly factor BamB